LNTFIFFLTPNLPGTTFLNVFKTDLKTPKGQTTRAELLEISLRLFREKGFDATTMRDIAAGAGMSLGAFYYYYPSKDSIVLDYYRQVQDEHARRVAERSSEASNLRARLGLLLHTKLDILADTRELTGALLRYTGNPDHPLSFLGAGTSAIREETIAMFRDALQPEHLAEDLMQMLPLLLWAMHMGILLYFLYDKSPAQQRTRKLTDMALDFTVRMISVSKIPVFRPVRRTLRGLLQEAGFIPAAA
jgi:AcrR family transcriptional regulator